MVFENRINFSIHTLILSAHALIASVRTLIALAHALIAPENPIRIRAHALIASTLPSDIAYSSTVLSGNTPCLTADDARRANPWESNTPPLRRQRRRTAAHLCSSELLPPRFQCDAAGVSPRVPPRFGSGIPAVKHSAPPPEA